jgi:hypothetical protein
MYIGRDFSEMDQGEDEPFALDFTDDLASGETVTSTNWTCTVAKGTDPDAATRLQGAAQMQGGKSVQRVSGLLPNVTYLLRANIVTSNLSTKSIWSHVRCTTPT